MLLSYAMRRIPYSFLLPEERLGIERCREIADLSIQDIAATVSLNQLCGWNAVWWTFQLSLVPLIGLFLNASGDGADDPQAGFESCQAQVQLAMMILERIRPYGYKAERSLDVISRLFEASKRTPEFQARDSDGDLNEQLGDDSDWSLPFLDTTNDEYLMWEYLSWSDNKFWEGTTQSDD